MLPNHTWQAMLQALTSAKHLQSLRICTGALFLGLPFRFDTAFITLLTQFREQTGVQVKLSCHVAHTEQITPEAIEYANRLRAAGIEILPQCPLEEGVNVWRNDMEKSILTLRRLDRLLSLAIGTRSYKWIVDMQGTVPLLFAIELWRTIHDCHQEDSDITRPTSFAAFLPLPIGNLNLSYHSLWAMEMKVNQAKNTVSYRIPHAAQEWVMYTEPLYAGINDNPKLLEQLRASLR